MDSILWNSMYSGMNCQCLLVLRKWCLPSTKEPAQKYWSLLSGQWRDWGFGGIPLHTGFRRRLLSFSLMSSFLWEHDYRSVMGFHTHWVRGKPRGGRRRDGKIDPCNLTIWHNSASEWDQTTSRQNRPWQDWCEYQLVHCSQAHPNSYEADIKLHILRDSA